MCMQSVRYAVMCFTARHILWSAALVRPERRLPGGWSDGFHPPHARDRQQLPASTKVERTSRKPDAIGTLASPVARPFPRSGFPQLTVCTLAAALLHIPTTFEP